MAETPQMLALRAAVLAGYFMATLSAVGDLFLYAPGTVEYMNACNRAARYHEITHHSARKMEFNIQVGYGLGCSCFRRRHLASC